MFAAPGMPAIRGTFTLDFEDNGKCSFSLIPEDFSTAWQYANLPLVMGSLMGNSTSPNFDMQIDRMYLNQITIDSGLRFTFQIFSPIKITLCLPSPQDYRSVQAWYY